SVNNNTLTKHFLNKNAYPNIPRPKDIWRHRQSPLHATVDCQNAEMMRLLLKGGADPTAAPGILHWATELGLVEMVDVLLDAGLRLEDRRVGRRGCCAGTALQMV